MNKKGFTLVELISIIVILALLITITATKGFGLFNQTKKEITQQNINVIKDGVNILLAEVNSCDEDLDEYLITNFSPTNKTCEGLKTRFNTECVAIRLDYMISKEYVSGSGVENLSENNPDAEVIVCNGKISEIINIDNTNEEPTNKIENPFTEGTLAYEIFKNAKDNKNGTKYSPTPLTKPAKEVSGSDEKTLSLTEDSLGTSYYFRGSVQDNYVLLNNMCFRIVRIEGDGSVKLIFAGDVSLGATTCNEVSYGTGYIKNADGSIVKIYYGHNNTNGIYYANYENFSDGLKETTENWYNSNFASSIIIKEDKWCLGGNINFKYNKKDDTEWQYAAGNRVLNSKTTNLMCNNEDYVMSKYGSLTSDEVMLAGGTIAQNSSYYLYDNGQVEPWWTLSQSYYKENYDFMFFVNKNGDLYKEYIDNYIDSFGVRPSITLIPEIISNGGDGTKTNPYIIN